MLLPHCECTPLRIGGCGSCQAVSLNDVRKELTFCRKAGMPILGVIENMSGFVCPHCSVRCLTSRARGSGPRLTNARAGVAHGVFGGRMWRSQECTNVFSSGGGEAMATEFGVPFLGNVEIQQRLSRVALHACSPYSPLNHAGDTARIPIDPQLTRAVETGANYLREQPSSPTTQIFLGLARSLPA